MKEQGAEQGVLQRMLEEGEKRNPGVAEALELYLAAEQVYRAAYTASLLTFSTASANSTAPRRPN